MNVDIIKQTLRQIAGTYAVKAGEVIGYEPQYWVAEDVSIDCCCYGDTYFLTLEDMQIIIDHLDKWIERYGSKEKVGETVKAWFDWCIDDAVDEMGNYRDHPRINLWSWLNGLRPEQLRWTDLEELTSLEMTARTLQYVMKTYPTSTVENAAKQIEARAELLRERHSRETEEAMKGSAAYREFQKAIDETKKEGF